MTDHFEFLLQYKLKNETEWRSIPFSDEILVGSGSDTDLQIIDGELSEIHFEIRENPTGVFLKDLSSADGFTMIDNVEIDADTPITLPVGSTFKAGEYDFTFTLNTQSAAQSENIFSNILKSVKRFGVYRSIAIGLFLIGFSIVFGMLVFRISFNNRQRKTPVPGEETEIAVETQVAGVVEEVSTAVFELSSTYEVETILSTIIAPGAGDVGLGLIDLSSSELNLSDLNQLSLSNGGSLEIALDVLGDNVGYIYQYSGLIIGDKVFAVTLNYVSADKEQFVDGVAAPSWDDEEIPINIEWEPYIYEIHDENQSVIGLLIPEQYGSLEEDTIYHLSGYYQRLNGETKYDAYLRFNGKGEMVDLLTFGQVGSERATPYRVNPKAGDSFTILNKVFFWDEDSSEEMLVQLPDNQIPKVLQELWWNSMKETLNQEGFFSFGPGEFIDIEGETLIFGEKGLSWTKNTEYSGDFVVGIAIEDLDGNYFLGYFPVQVIK